MIVLDCSAAVEIVLDTPQGNAFEGLIREGERVIVPNLFHAEIACAFWKYARTGVYSEKQCVGFIEDARQMIDRFIPLDDFSIEALSEGVRLDHSPYDMFYFILARRNAATLMTMDRKLMQLCEEQGVDYVRTIAL